jgi:hypothetical protein
LHEAKPKFGQFETWGACSRCGARVRYSTLARERLTGLLVCSSTSGRPVRPCLDPWPPVYDFQVHPDKSIDPPPEPLPVRWGLDKIWSTNDMKVAPHDSARVQSYMVPPTNLRGTASFVSYQRTLNQNQDRATLLHINSADYDGTFVPSNSVRTVEPPETFHFPWMNTGG